MLVLNHYSGCFRAINKKIVFFCTLYFCLVAITPCDSAVFAYRGTFTTSEASDIFSYTNLWESENTLFGPSGVGQIKSLEFSPFDGYLYGLNPSMSFYKIDTITGNATLIKNGIINGFGESSLAFAPDGTLYGMHETNNDGNIGSLFKIDILTGDVIEVPGSSMLYGTTAFAISHQGVGIGWSQSDKLLYEINLLDGTTNIIGTMNWDSGNKLLAFDYAPDGTLYGSTGGNFYVIDTTSVTASMGGSFHVGGGEGFAITPEPTIFVMLTLGSLILRRKHCK